MADWAQELLDVINTLAGIDGVITIMRPRENNRFDIELRYLGYTYIERLDTVFVEESPKLIAVTLLGTLFTEYYRAKQERL